MLSEPRVVSDDPVADDLYERAAQIAAEREERKVRRVASSIAAAIGLILLGFWLRLYWPETPIVIKGGIVLLALWSSANLVRIVLGATTDTSTGMAAVINPLLFAPAIFVITGMANGWPTPLSRDQALSELGIHFDAKQFSPSQPWLKTGIYAQRGSLIQISRFNVKTTSQNKSCGVGGCNSGHIGRLIDENSGSFAGLIRIDNGPSLQRRRENDGLFEADRDGEVRVAVNQRANSDDAWRYIEGGFFVRLVLPQ